MRCWEGTQLGHMHCTPRGPGASQPAPMCAGQEAAVGGQGAWGAPGEGGSGIREWTLAKKGAGNGDTGIGLGGGRMRPCSGERGCEFVVWDGRWGGQEGNGLGWRFGKMGTNRGGERGIFAGLAGTRVCRLIVANQEWTGRLNKGGVVGGEGCTGCEVNNTPRPRLAWRQVQGTALPASREARSGWWGG